jgi:hypothetical protein
VTSAQLTLRLLDRPVTVTSEVDGLIPWLREFCVPIFDEIDPVTTAAEVIVRDGIDPDESPAGDEVLPCFALGEELSFLKGTWSGTSGVVDDDYFGARIAVEPGRVEVQASAPPHRIRPAAFRVCNELLMAPRASEDIHASAFAVNGRVILFAGPKNAGKTTLLVRVASVVEGGIVSNDRVLLDRRPEGVRARGIPTFVSVREGTRALQPKLFNGVGNLADRLDRTVAELQGLPPEPPLDGKTRMYGFSPLQFANIVGSRVAPGGPAAAIALVSVDLAVGTFAIDRLSKDEMIRRLSGCFRSAATGRPPTVFERCLGYDAIPPVPGLAAEIAELVPCVGVRAGEGLLTDDAATRELVATLVA